ncbi:hypothetical protein D3C80_1055090 [compost metagenome]
MPANVFAPQQQFALVVHEQCRVYRTAVLAQRLESIDALAQAVEPVRGRQRGARQRLQFRQRLFQGFDTAQTAATGASQLAPLVFQVPEGAAGDFYFCADRRTPAGELEVIDVVRRSDDAAAEAEADDKVFKVGRAHQHYRLVDAVVGNAQGDFFGQRCAGLAVIGQVAVVIAVAGRGRSQGGGRRAGRRCCAH